MNTWEDIPQDDDTKSLVMLNIQGLGSFMTLTKFSDTYKTKVMYSHSFFTKEKKEKTEKPGPKKRGGLSL